MNKIIILFVAIALISCKKDNPTTALNVKGDIETKRLVDDITCNGTTYIFQIPYYKGDATTEQRLNRDFLELIGKEDGDNMESVWDDFINERKENLCNNNSGLMNITVEHTSQTEHFISYEISYTRDGKKGRILKTYKKPELTEINIIDLTKKEKEQDIKTILDINLQQSIANLSLDVPQEDQTSFREYIYQGNKIHSFETQELKSSTMGINVLGPDSLRIQVAKSIKLPSNFSYLNSDVKMEILAREMDYYLDLSSLKGNN